jgi:plastocyanin
MRSWQPRSAIQPIRAGGIAFPPSATHPLVAIAHAATAVIRIGRNPILHSPSSCRRNIVRTGHLIPHLAFAATLLLGSTAASAANHTVQVGPNGSLTFSPQTLNIAAGDTVTFTNNGGFHNAVSDDGTTFNSGAASSAAWTYVATFPTPGTFGYHCTIHGAANNGMFGTINVTVPVDLQSFDVN